MIPLRAVNALIPGAVYLQGVHTVLLLCRLKDSLPVRTIEAEMSLREYSRSKSDWN